MLRQRVKVAKSTFTTMPGDVAVLMQATRVSTPLSRPPSLGQCFTARHHLSARTHCSNSHTAHCTQDSPEVRTSPRRIDHCRKQIVLSRAQGDAAAASEGGQVHLHHYAGGRSSPEDKSRISVHLSQDHHYPSAKHSLYPSLALSQRILHARLTRSTH